MNVYENEPKHTGLMLHKSNDAVRDSSHENARNLLSAVLDPNGHICIVGLHPKRRAVQRFFEPGDYFGAVDAAMCLSEEGMNPYFATSTLLTQSNRKADNVHAVKAVKVDLDVGREKPYATKKDAVADLLNFCEKVSLPLPTMIDSGNGVHAYWILEAALEPLKAKQLLEKFKTICEAHDLYADPVVTADIARILRVPGTLNYKDEAKPKEVKLKSEVVTHPTETIIAIIEQAMSGLHRTHQQAYDLSTLQETQANITSINNMLQRISADCDYVLYRNVIWAIHSTGWSCAEEMERNWSMTAPERFDEKTFQEIRRSFKPGGITYKSLPYYAGQIAQPTPPILLPSPARFPLLSMEELSELPPVTWRIKGVLPTKGLAAIYGPSGSGKSFLVLDMLCNITSGIDWFGRKVDAAPVVYVALEGQGGIYKRLKAWQTHHNAPIPEQFKVMVDNLSLFSSGDIQAFADVVIAGGVSGGVIVIDTLNQSAPEADENKSQDMSRIISNAMLLHRMTDSLVILIHHVGKDAGRGLRGHSSLLAALDGAIEVTSGTAGRDWKLAKSKDSESGMVFPFRLESVLLGKDEDGEGITSCVALSDLFSDRKSKVKPPSGKNQKLALELIRQLIQKLPADSEKRILFQDAIDAASNRLGVTNKRSKERASEAVNSLIVSGHIKLEDGYICAV